MTTKNKITEASIKITLKDALRILIAGILKEINFLRQINGSHTDRKWLRNRKNDFAILENERASYIQ